MPTTACGPHTIKDWLATPVGEHWQLIHGNLIITEETADNSSLAGEIEVELALYLREERRGIVRRNIAFSFPGIMDADHEGVVPDLCFIPNDQLVAEMLSASTRKIDLKDKVEIYREAGVAEYWIFDLDEESVRIYRFGENRRTPFEIKSFGDILTTPLLPGFSLNLPNIRRAIGLE
ncbi:Uma2 family endonuclease [Verrucomicrobium sp. 3C]|uniref:Uma2 family endonuclease n=1 Tax=Verrucomicrobium sp. 3C TaxID=1134055 RepID=UPI00036A4B03|nr:Uma2 family endonuclease [Verrucomicrobium sp. 3C]